MGLCRADRFVQLVARLPQRGQPFLLPDANRDREMFQFIEDNKPSAWRVAAFDQVEAAGEQKMLTSFCLAGGAEHLGGCPEWLSMVETRLLTSDKVFAA
jgi:hypothetical protein